MNKVRLTPEAINDLLELKAYIADKLQNPLAAEGTVSRIMQSIRILQQHAEAGPSVEATTGYKTDLRFLVCGNYIAIYRIDGKTVSIARAFNGRQDYLRILFGNTAQI